MENSNDHYVQDATDSPRSFATFRKDGWIFGRFGPRAAWGILAYVAIWAVASTIASIFALGATGQFTAIMKAQMQAQAHPGAPHQAPQILFTSVFVIVNDGLPFLAMLGAAWLFSRGERRPFGSYGIGRKRLTDFFPGALCGLLIMSALVWLLHTLHLLVFDSRALTLGPALFHGCKWFLAFLMVGGAEEYFFRGYVQYTLMRGLWGLAERVAPRNPRPIAFWSAATLLSLVFAAMHKGNGGETHFGLLTVFFAGMLFAYALWRTGSLWWALGFHTTWDWAQSFLFGVPDSGNVSIGRLFVTHPTGNPALSGGSVGPEGSAFVLVAFLVALLILRFTRGGEQPNIEQAPLANDVAQIPNVAIS